MPSKSAKQARTMAAAAHDPAFAAKMGIPPKVAKDFNRADTGTQLLKQALTVKELRRPPRPKQEIESPAEERSRGEEKD